MFAVDTKMVAAYAANQGDASSVSIPIAALAVVGPLTWSLTVIFTVTAVGTTAVVGRRFGSGRLDDARSITTAAAWLSLGVGLIVSIIGMLSASTIVDAVLVNADKSDAHDLAEAARGYLWWFFLFFPFRVISLTLIGALRGAGDTATPFWGGIVANGFNAGGNALFIFGLWGLPALGVEGAGIGIGLAGVGELLFVAWVLFRSKRSKLRLRAADLTHWDSNGAKSVVRVSSGALGDAVVFHTGFIVYQFAIFYLDQQSIAAHRVAITIQSLAFMPAAGFYASAASLSGRLLGAGEKRLASQSALWNTGLGLAFLLPVMGVFLLAGEPLARFLVGDEPEIASLAATCLAIGSIEIPFLLITESLRGTLRGAGETRQPMWVTVLGTWCIRVPGAWFFAITLGWGLTGIWITTVLDWIVRATVMVVLFRRGSWRDRIL